MISVVIPVYNAEPWLDRCVRSALDQTIRDIEVICVDDASSDGSVPLLEGISAVDSRLRVIRFQENRGVSAARNAGLDAARGEYVYFLDSDDWLDPDYLEAVLSMAVTTGRDIVINSNYAEEFPHAGKRAFSGDFGFITKESGVYPLEVVQTRFPPVVWGRFYRRGFLLDKAVRFPPPSVRNGTEDIFFTGLSDAYQPDAFVFRGPWYHYLQRPESLLHKKDLPYYNIVSFKALNDARKERKLPAEGLRLFYAGPVVLDSEDKFVFCHGFFSEIGPRVRRHEDLYASIDLFLMEAVLSSGDYLTFLKNFNPNISISFIRTRIRKELSLEREQISQKGL